MLDKTYALKQPLSTRGQSNNIPARRTIPRFLPTFDTTSLKSVSNVNLEFRIQIFH